MTRKVMLLEECIKSLNDLANWNHELVFDRGSGGIMQDRKDTIIRKLKPDTIPQTITREYRFRFENNNWEVGFFLRPWGTTWIPVSSHGKDMDSARVEAMWLQEKENNCHDGN